MASHDESREQRALVAWADKAPLPGCPGEKIGEHLAAVPNGGQRSKIEAGIMKAEGVRAGYPDLLLDLARGNWHGLRIELKRSAAAGPSKVSPEQRERIERLEGQGYKAVVCRGWDSARAIIEWYVGLPSPQLAKQEVPPCPAT